MFPIFPQTKFLRRAQINILESLLMGSGVGRILVWGGPYRGAEGAEGGGVRGGGPPGEGPGEGAVPPPQKIFDYLILKWRNLVTSQVF